LIITLNNHPSKIAERISPKFGCEETLVRQLQHFGGFWLAGAISVSVSVVAAQPAWAQIVSVTTIQLKSTDSGIEVILPGVTSPPEQIITKILVIA